MIEMINNGLWYVKKNDMKNEKKCILGIKGNWIGPKSWERNVKKCISFEKIDYHCHFIYIYVYIR